jgi:hypothetical protein
MSLEDNNKLAFVGLLNSVSDSLGRALTEKKQERSDSGSDSESDSGSDGESECRHNPTNYFTLKDSDEPKIPIYDGTDYFVHNKRVRAFLIYHQVKKALKHDCLVHLENHLKRLYQIQPYWHTNYLECIIKMRDNSLRHLQHDDIVDRVELLNDFILQEL